jgi:pimeloyl-ACP methyl ester carboxylesterase
LLTAPRIVRAVAIFALIHGAGHDGWCWHLLDEELRRRGHTVVAPDLPCDDLTAAWDIYTRTVAALPAGEPVVVVGHSLGAMTAALVASIVPVRMAIYLAPSTPTNRTFDDMPPSFQTSQAPGPVEDGRGGDYWPDPHHAVQYMYPRLDPGLARAAAARLRYQASPGPYPLEGPPAVPSAYLLATEDEIFTVASRRWAAARVFGLDPIELAGGHFPMLEQPAALAGLLGELVAET